MNIIITILVLGVIIFFHELGHYLTGKLFKMPISEFSLGMGPSLMSFETSETKYSVRMIPLGGYVSVDGMELESEVEGGFNSQHPIKRFIVLIAGVVMNFLLALVLIFSILMTDGKMQTSEEPVVGGVLEKSDASKNLKVGDRILEVDGERILKWSDLQKIGNKNEKVDSHTLKIVRNGSEEVVKVAPRYDEEMKRNIIGVTPVIIKMDYTIKEGVKESFTTFKRVFKMTVDGFVGMVSGKFKGKDLTGPIGMIKIVGEANTQGGLKVLVWLTAVISVNIGLFNLLPFPALDGGRILFIILEGLKIKVNKKLEERLHTIGMIILLILIIYISINDVTNLFRR